MLSLPRISTLRSMTCFGHGSKPKNQKTKKPKNQKPKKTKKIKKIKKKQKTTNVFYWTQIGMAEPHGNRLINSVEQTLNTIRTFTPKKAYRHILSQEVPVILAVFRNIDETAERLDKPTPKSLPTRERLSQEALKRAALPLLYGIMNIAVERVKSYLTALKEGAPFEFYNPQEKIYIQTTAQTMEPNIVAAATMRNMKRSAKQNAATKRKNAYSQAIIPLSTTRRNIRTARNVAINLRNQELKNMVLEAEESEEINHNVLWAKVYLQRAKDLLEDATEFANPDAYKLARQAVSSAEFTLNTANVLRERKTTRTNLQSNNHKKAIDNLITDKKRTEKLLYATEILLFNDNPKHFIPPIYPVNVIAQKPLGLN